jgi:hypothetical protein
MDIHEGELLTVGGIDYPIRSCAPWSMAKQSQPSFARMAVLTVSTKGSVIEGTLRKAAATKLTGLKCTPLDPVSAELAATVVLDTPCQLVQTFLTDGTGFVHLVLEVLK